MPVIHDKDVLEGIDALDQWNKAARKELDVALADAGDSGDDAGRADTTLAARLAVAPRLPRRAMAMAVRYSLSILEQAAPGEGVEVRVAPFAAVKVMDGPASDPHNLTPPDVIELAPDVWLRLACGITTWGEEKQAGRIAAAGPRDDLSPFLPLL